MVSLLWLSLLWLLRIVFVWNDTLEGAKVNHNEADEGERHVHTGGWMRRKEQEGLTARIFQQHVLLAAEQAFGLGILSLISTKIADSTNTKRKIKRKESHVGL
jgi:hypothetical protein